MSNLNAMLLNLDDMAPLSPMPPVAARAPDENRSWIETSESPSPATATAPATATIDNASTPASSAAAMPALATPASATESTQDSSFSVMHQAPSVAPEAKEAKAPVTSTPAVAVPAATASPNASGLIADLRKEISSQKSTLEQLKASSHDILDKMEKNDTHANESAEKATQRHTESTRAASALNKSFDGLDGALSAIAKLNERLTMVESGLAARFDKLDAAVRALPATVADKTAAATVVELARHNAAQSFSQSTAAQPKSASTGSTPSMLAASTAAATAASNAASLTRSASPGPDDERAAPAASFAQWRPLLQAPGAVTLEAARAPPAAISPAPTMMASSPIMSSAPREQKPVTVHSPGYATNYNYSSLPPQTSYAPSAVAPQFSGSYTYPQPSPTPSPVPQMHTGPSNYASFTSTTPDYAHAGAVSYPETYRAPSVSSAAPATTSSSRAPSGMNSGVDAHARQLAEDEALALRLQREMDAQSAPPPPAAATQPARSPPTQTMSRPAPTTSNSNAEMRNCPVCQVSVASDMLELHVNEHFEAESELAQGASSGVVMGQNAQKPAAQAKPPGFLSRLLGVGGTKPATATSTTPVVQSTPPSTQSPVYSNPNRSFAQQASSYYPQTQMSSPPSGNLYPQQYPSFRAN